MKLSSFAILLVTLLAIPSCRDTSEPKEPGSAQKSDASQTLRVFTWEDYIDEDVVTEFTEETGIEVEFVYFDNLEIMKAQVRSNPGAYDLVVVDDFYLAELIDLRLVGKINRSEIENFDNFDAKYLGLPFGSD